MESGSILATGATNFFLLRFGKPVDPDGIVAAAFSVFLPATAATGTVAVAGPAPSSPATALLSISTKYLFS